MSRDPFWITDLNRGHDVEIASPLSPAAEAFLLEVKTLRTSAQPGEGRRVECRAHDQDPRLAEFREDDGQVHGIWMYVQLRGTRWVLCHYPFDRKPGVHLGQHVIETPDHREIKDLWQWALEDGGSCRQVIQEHQIGTRTFDVWAATSSGEAIAIEADHSTRSLNVARRKDRADQTLGLAATVFCADRAAPPYADRVAHTELQDKHERNGRPHPRHWPIARGPRVVQFRRCRAGGPWNRCPDKPARERGPAYCGSEHPFLTSWTDVGYPLSVADVGEMLPAGDLAVVRPGIQRIDACLVRAADARAMNDWLRDRKVDPRTEYRQDASKHDRTITPEELAKRNPLSLEVVSNPEHAGRSEPDDDALVARPGVMRAKWWLRCRGCDDLVHGPGSADQPCPCGERHAVGDLVALVDLEDGRAWTCRSCFTATLIADRVPEPRDPEAPPDPDPSRSVTHRHLP